MYFPFYIAYMVAGFAISLPVFFWALNKGQFSDQQRARYLALEERPEHGALRLSRIGRWHALILVTMAGSGLVASVVAVILSLVAAGG
jgi:nitrogen fixation-related uncharacterized protein